MTTAPRPAQAVDAAVDKLSVARETVGTGAGSRVPSRGPGPVVHMAPSATQRS